MTKHDIKKKGIVIGLILITLNIFAVLYISSFKTDIIKPHQGIKFTLAGMYNIALAFQTLASHRYQNESFLFRFWTAFTNKIFLYEFKNQYIISTIFFFLSGIFTLLIGLGVIKI